VTTTPKEKTPTDPPPSGVAGGQAIALARAAEEMERLREQVAVLQADAEQRDAADDPTRYSHPHAGSGHLEERMARVTAHVSRIPKRGFNPEQKYNFVAHSDVLDSIRPALAAEGVQFRSKITRTDADAETKGDGSIRTTGGGMIWRMWRVEVEFTLACWNDDKRCEQVTAGWPGYAQDYSDKGASKALTSAIKTFLIQQFLVSTGDDPDEPTTDNTGGGTQRAAAPRNAGALVADVRAARNTCLDWNQKLPNGVLSKIARKVAGQGVIMNITDVAQLQKIAKAAERYAANPEGGQAWLDGDAQEQAAAPDPTDTERQAAHEQGDVPLRERDLSQPMTPTGVQPDGTGLPEEPVTPTGPWGIPVESYDPPLTEAEKEQHALGLNPRPVADGDDTPF
jgi:ERF superfamily